MSDDEDGLGFACELDLSSDWVEDTEDESSVLTAHYYTGDPTSLRQFLTGPAAVLTLDCYGEDALAQPALADVVDLLLQRPDYVDTPEVSYRSVPAGPAVRLQGPCSQRSWGGLRRQKGHVVTYAIAPPGRNEIIELTVAWPNRHHHPDIASLADALIPTLRLVPVPGADTPDDPDQPSHK